MYVFQCHYVYINMFIHMSMVHDFSIFPSYATVVNKKLRLNVAVRIPLVQEGE